MSETKETIDVSVPTDKPAELAKDEVRRCVGLTKPLPTDCVRRNGTMLAPDELARCRGGGVLYALRVRIVGSAGSLPLLPLRR